MMTRGLTIVELDAEDPAAVDAAFRIGNEAILADLPDWAPNCRYEHEARLRVPHPAQERHTFLAYVDGTPAGLVQLDLPLHDNRTLATVDVLVLPEHRRQGVGRALYGHAAEFCRARGRTSLLGFSVITDADGRPKGGSAGFAAAVGQENKLVDVRRRLDLATVDEAALDRLLAEALPKAAGYSTVEWVGMPPAELIDDIAALDSSFIEETPLGELEYEPEKVDAERLRRMCETRLRYGVRAYETGVVHESTGRLVAWSVLRVAKTVEWHAWQQITLVHPAHRGHRLGILAKVVNLRALRAQEPAVRVIDTFNADVNKHMIAINEAMGFRVVDSWANWQTSVA